MSDPDNTDYLKKWFLDEYEILLEKLKEAVRDNQEDKKHDQQRSSKRRQRPFR